MIVLCTPDQSFELRKFDMVSEKIPFQVRSTVPICQIGVSEIGV